MKRFCAVLVSTLLLAGCRTQQPTTNPFLRTTVAPPATGTGAVVVPTEPYTSAPIVSPGTPMTPAPVAAPAVVTPMPASAPAPPPFIPKKDSTSPPGGDFLFHQSSTDEPQSGVQLAAAIEPVESATAASVARPAGEPARLQDRSFAAAQAVPQPATGAPNRGDPPETVSASPGNTIRIVGPSTPATATAATSPQAQASAVTLAGANAQPPANPVIRMTVGGSGPVQSTIRTDASAAATSAASTTGRPATSTGNTAQFVAAGNRQPGVVQASFQPNDTSTRYAHAADYSTLRGKLEYSQAAKQWKLRYIPIDGEMDKFGGSVVIADGKMLESYKAGDYVAVRGAIAAQGTSGYAPSYQLHQVELLAR